MKHPDVCIAGAGIIGLTLALALHRRKLSVLVLDSGAPLTEASVAAAGMLAVDDPDNPPELHALARFSREQYPALLSELDRTSSLPIAFQTHQTLQAVPLTPASGSPPGAPLQNFLPRAASAPAQFVSLAEESLDPRELAPALLAAVLASPVHLQTNRAVLSVAETSRSVVVKTASDTIEAAHFVDCTGAWSLSTARVPSLRVVPRKGQMLSVPTPASLAAGIVIRSHEVYLVPRLHGLRAGETVIGATVEDAGFDRSLDPRQLAVLLGRASALLPELHGAPLLSSWSGLRPATQDLLPAIGHLPGASRLFIASGHYRNGILLAPGTAELLAAQISGKPPSGLLARFAPDRFLGGVAATPSAS